MSTQMGSRFVCFPRLHFLLRSIHIVETAINSAMSLLMSICFQLIKLQCWQKRPCTFILFTDSFPICRDSLFSHWTVM